MAKNVAAQIWPTADTFIRPTYGVMALGRAASGHAVAPPQAGQSILVEV